MKEGLLDKQVLAMYDVRGIQSYIFKSNKAKEIIGASVIVANIITDGLDKYIENRVQDDDKLKYLTNWKKDCPTAFIDNKDIAMQVMFVGGGNAYVLFRTGEICSEVNKFLAKYVLNATYSLNLAVAVVKKTESYADDYNAINEEMRNIKAYMPLTQPVGAMPFMEADSITGYPITCREKVDKNTEISLCTEARLKSEAFPDYEDEKIFDNMVSEKGDNSMLAVCHIDGNSMGKRIIREMNEVKDYSEAIRKMRKLSLSISSTFEEAFGKMTSYMDEMSDKVSEKAVKSGHKLYRRIIVAGDDITFVCNAKLAIPAVKKFIGSLCDGGNSKYSACGGIAIFNSHFPFSDAYEVAEACCDSAKERAKKNKDGSGQIGNYIDFQMCTNISASHLGNYRDRHYVSDIGSFIARPYYVAQENDSKGIREAGKKYDIQDFINVCQYLINKPRSKAKLFRDAISSGKNEIKQLNTFLKSRDFCINQEFGDDDDKINWPVVYDAVEMMDLCVPELFKNDKKDGAEV